MKKLRFSVTSMVIFAAMTLPAWPQGKTTDLTGQSLEDLMNVQVVSASKTEPKLSHTASAVFVITQEGIRRSGATNIPNLLRMVPGVDVAEINSNTWSISERGFNGRFSSELLVLGETDGFAQAGGTVQLTLEEDRVRFTINPDAAERAALLPRWRKS